MELSYVVETICAARGRAGRLDDFDRAYLLGGRTEGGPEAILGTALAAPAAAIAVEPAAKDCLIADAFVLIERALGS